MRRISGFTLIELMITVAIIGILTAIAYPSYMDHIRRAMRSAGQQFLADIAQRQEQYFLDQRTYATQLAAGAGGLGMVMPPDVAAKYQAPVFTVVAGPPPGFRINMIPIGGGLMTNDGTLIINSVQQRWRSATPADDTFNAPGDCRWEDSRCTPS